MKAICPNDKTHSTFTTVAHVMQEWLVDENGEFLEVREEALQTSFPPNRDNTWTCDACGAEAEIID